MEHPNKWSMAELQVNECFHSYPSLDMKDETCALSFRLALSFLLYIWTNPCTTVERIVAEFFQNLLVVKVNYTRRFLRTMLNKTFRENN